MTAKNGSLLIHVMLRAKSSSFFVLMKFKIEKRKYNICFVDYFIWNFLPFRISDNSSSSVVYKFFNDHDHNHKTKPNPAKTRKYLSSDRGHIYFSKYMQHKSHDFKNCSITNLPGLQHIISLNIFIGFYTAHLCILAKIRFLENTTLNLTEHHFYEFVICSHNR